MKNLKTLLLVMVLFAFAGTASAQIGVGARVGLGSPTLIGKDANGLRSKVGGVFGFVFPIKLSKNLRFQPELLLVQKGARTGGGYYGYGYYGYGYGIGAARLSNLYLEIPLVVQYLFPIGNSKFSIYAEAGVSLGVWLSSRQKGGGYNEKIKLKDTDAIRADVALLVGGGAIWKVGPGELFAGPRITPGLVPLYKDARVFNFLFSFTAGYTFFFGKE